MRYSRVNSTEKVYHASTAVFMAEIVKIGTCLCMLLHQKQKLQAIFVPHELFQIFIPSALYALQNNLLYIALSNLEAATFQVTYQLKILSTAIFSILLLHRTLSLSQWSSLVLLMAGVTCVQLDHATVSEDVQRPLIGLLSVMISCVSSGFAGCYFEKLLKSNTRSMWIRNMQLALCGAIFSFFGILWNAQEIWQDGFFQGYHCLTWCVIINQALGGLLVAMVVKYADNILKGFATSISILLSGFISFFLFDFSPSVLYLLGTLIVILSTLLYAY
ncbi:nucleotide-sugar transporter [Sporodiniella umbellata]|nr:nucleotide-sugar transporter [Sporodiniella umbellata]